LVHVDADPDNGKGQRAAVQLRLHENPSSLAVADQQVIRPAQVDAHACNGLN